MKVPLRRQERAAASRGVAEPSRVATARGPSVRSAQSSDGADEEEYCVELTDFARMSFRPASSSERA